MLVSGHEAWNAEVYDFREVFSSLPLQGSGMPVSLMPALLNFQPVFEVIYIVTGRADSILAFVLPSS